MRYVCINGDPKGFDVSPQPFGGGLQAPSLDMPSIFDQRCSLFETGHDTFAHLVHQRNDWLVKSAVVGWPGSNWAVASRKGVAPPEIVGSHE